MLLDLLANITPYEILILIAFILFVLSLKKVLEIVKNALIIAAAAVLFPIVANKVLGLPIPMDGDTIVSFVVVGIVCYFIYLVVKSAYVLLKKGGSLAKKVLPDVKLDKKVKPVAEKEEKEDTKEKKPPVSLLKKQLQSKKKEKDLFRDYAVVEDKEEVKKEPRKIKHGVVEEREEEEKEEESIIEPIKEINFRKKRGKKKK